MTQVEEHITFLLGDWHYNERLRNFAWGDFRLQHHGEELDLRLRKDFIDSVPVPDNVPLRDVHHALRSLLQSVPWYDVVHIQEIR